MAESLAPRARSLYRAILRELPRRPLSKPSPLQAHIRNSFSSDAAQDGDVLLRRLEEAEQFVQYAKAQRTYAMLLERYNPGMEMDQQERVRLTARRVGLDMPIEHRPKEE